MRVNIKLTAVLEFEDEKEAEIAYRAVKLEVISSPSDRAEGSIFLRNNKIFIRLTGSDRSAVRSSLNSYMRWLKLTKELIEYGKKDA